MYIPTEMYIHSTFFKEILTELFRTKFIFKFVNICMKYITYSVSKLVAFFQHKLLIFHYVTLIIKLKINDILKIVLCIKFNILIHY